MEVIFIYHYLFIFWNIGKKVWDSRDKCLNPVEKISSLCSYYYGNSHLFNREDVKLMRRFYLDFPIFYNSMSKITWEQYKKILVLNNKEERHFYYYLSIFFNSNLDETIEFITNDYFVRI